MLCAAGSSTRRGPDVGSCSRVLSEDVGYCIGLRCIAQYPVGRVRGWGGRVRFSGRRKTTRLWRYQNIIRLIEADLSDSRRLAISRLRGRSRCGQPAAAHRVAVSGRLTCALPPAQAADHGQAPIPESRCTGGLPRPRVPHWRTHNVGSALDAPRCEISGCDDDATGRREPRSTPSFPAVIDRHRSRQGHACE